MRYGLMLGLIAVGLGALALEYRVSPALAIWVVGSWLVVAAAYLLRLPKLLGKRSDGRVSPLATVALGPYLAPTWLMFELQRLLSRESPVDLIANGLFISRRPYPSEIPPGVGLIVDLTAEFPERKDVRERWRVIHVPVLDGSAPTREQIDAIVHAIERARAPVIIHCAQGHGRSAVATCAVLISRGATLENAEMTVLERRPGARMNSDQRRFLSELFSD